MRFMIVAMSDGTVYGAVTRTKAQAFDWLKTCVEPTVKLAAWRYWNNGWADSSDDEAWRLIQSLPDMVTVEIYR